MASDAGELGFVSSFVIRLFHATVTDVSKRLFLSQQEYEMIVTFSQHLEKLMSRDGLSKAELARRAGVSHVAIGNYLKGRIPKYAELEKIARVFGMNPDDLVNVKQLREVIEEADRKASQAGGSLDHQNAVFNNLLTGGGVPPVEARATGKHQSQSKVAEDVPKQGVKAKSANTPTMASNVKILGPVDDIFFGTVPVISWAHAGTATSYEELPSHWQERIPTMCRGKRAFGLTIEGDSMTTQCQPGDIVTVDPDVEPRNGCLVVVKLKNDGVMLRRFTRLSEERVKLIAYNTLYPSTEHSLNEFHWIYPVHSTFRRELF